ncbi:Nucleotide-binding universal stress protein, UspA family [Nocardioides exalbidus]|uniref:Nucleotide-binding universal stress protein, UspA family n=1 Tax=Nocardioides exalbidus TaxID=402596 RepID=A0A1H4YBR3_9ACTN|nr:universal stress protein [Nocardioides exalbidus]SED14690.1 Nucleotide-binding universal stress protein, UspA family [Nocardioides exalbidus]
MQTFPIVIAYDESPDARRALIWAATEAVDSKRPLLVLMIEDVQETPTAPGVAGKVPSLVPHALEEARTLIADLGVPSVQFEHRLGRVVSVLLGIADSAACVVMGSHGHGPFGEAMLGSVSNNVARHATCPVVVVRQPRVTGARRIVVGVDGSPHSNAALEYACARAERTLEKVFAVHATHHDDLSALGERYESLHADQDRLQETIHEAAASARRKHPDVHVEVEEWPGAPARALADASRNASLLVVGSRGRGYVNGLLLGSVSQAALHRAQCPVAVVR